MAEGGHERGIRRQAPAEDVGEAEEGRRIRDRGPGVADRFLQPGISRELDHAALVVTAEQVLTPSGQGECREGDGPTLVELRFDGRHEELGELGGAVEADAGHLVAHFGVGEALRHHPLVVFDIDAGDGRQRWGHLFVVETAHVLRQGWVGHDLVDVGVADERGEVRRSGVAGVEDAQLQRLVGPHVVGEENAGVLVGRSAVRELVFDDPLDEGLSNDRPVIDQPVLRGQELAVGRRRLWRDAVDHAIGEGDVLPCPLLQSRLEHGGHAQRCRPGRTAVAHDVVAAQDGEAAHPGITPGLECASQSLEGGRQGLPRGGQEITRGLVDGIATLGDGERHDPSPGLRQGRDQRVDGRRGQDVVSERTDDAHGGGVTVAGDQRVEVVLRPRAPPPWRCHQAGRRRR